MVFLLDVNVLVALIDSQHVFHLRATTWFSSIRPGQWATCPITETGVLRIMSGHHYPGSPGGPALIADMLRILKSNKGHVFWPDDLNLLDDAIVDSGKLLTSGQVTDTYLLALAASHGGMLATFDERLRTTAVVGGRQFLYIIS